MIWFWVRFEAMNLTRMHFICHGAANVHALPDGKFESGFWKVAKKHAETVHVIAFHESRDSDSYLQGIVVGLRQVMH